jgi:hypothetical protein
MEEKKQHLLNDYYYSLEEIAELFLEIDKILHFANTKNTGLKRRRSTVFIDVTGARAISGYGTAYNRLSSIKILIKRSLVYVRMKMTY